MRPLSNVIGIDDGPFSRDHRGDVPIVGAVYARDRLDGILISQVRRDGANATARVVAMVKDSPFNAHIRAVLLNGIAMAGFNVVDIHAVAMELERPVLVVCRKQPDLRAIRRALLTRVPGGQRKLRLIERAGPMEPLGQLFVQRAGLDARQASALMEAHASHARVPEPLRVAHLFAGALVTRTSRGRA